MTDLMKPCGTILNKDGSTIPEKDRRGCETEQDYPECFFKGTDEASQGAVKSEDGWDGVRRIAITDRKDKDGNTIPWVVELDPNVELSENYRNPTLEDLHFITKQELGEYKDNDGRSQFNMICRSNLLMNPKEPYKFFFARDFFSDHASKVLFKNEYNRLENGDAFDRGKAFSLSREEGLSLVKVLNLDKNDIACKGGSCIKASGDGKFSQGQYFFTSNPDRLGDMIDNLLDFEGVRMAGMTDARRKELATHLTAIREKATEGRLYMEKQLEFLDTQSRNSNLGMAATALIGFGILYHPVKDIMGSIFGRVKATNFGEQIRAMLKANPAYDIVGRDAEAIQAWKMTDTVGYRSVILDAPTGEGKDVIVEKMIIMKEKGDPVVPERFRKAKVVRLDAAEFQSGTKYRGTVADKVKDIGKMAKKGPVIVYISEIDLVVLSGGSSEGNTEKVSKLLQNTLDLHKENLVVIGTTSRGSQMLADTPDLHRRFNWPKVRQLGIGEIAKIINDGYTKMAYEKAYGVKIGGKVVDAAAKLAESVYRPDSIVVDRFSGNASPMPRFDAVKNVLEDAAKLARDGKRVDVTIEDVIKATEARVSKSLDRVHVQKILKSEFGLAGLEKPVAKQVVKQAVKPAGKQAIRPAAASKSVPMKAKHVVGKAQHSSAMPTELQIKNQLMGQKWFRGLMPKQQSQIVGHYNRMLKNPKFSKGLVSGGKINAKGMNVLFKSIPKGADSGAPVHYLKYKQAADPKQMQKNGKVKGAKGKKGNARQVKGK